MTAPAKPLWHNPTGIAGIRTVLARLAHARRWNMPVIRFFFRLLVAGAHHQKTPIFGPIYKRVLLFTPVERQHTSAILLPFNATAVPATIEVGADLAAQADASPLPIDLIKDCLRKSSYIGAMRTCVCRDAFGCTTHSHDVCCMFLSRSGRRVVSYGIADEMSLEDAFARVDRAAAEGLVGQALWVEVEQFVWGFHNSDMDGFLEICFCCPCCCTAMSVCRSAARDVKGHFRSSGYQAVLDGSLCTGCGDCVPGCIGEAITMAAGAGRIRIDLANCVGCGMCATTCATDAIAIARTKPVYPSIHQQLLEQSGLPLVV